MEKIRNKISRFFAPDSTFINETKTFTASDKRMAYYVFGFLCVSLIILGLIA